MAEPEGPPMDLSEDRPGDRDVPGLPITLSGQRRALRLALARWDAQQGSIDQPVATMYDGALLTWHGHPGNPERRHQTAHSLRELIEKLVFRPEGTLRQQVDALKLAWQAACSESSCRSGESWSGRIDTPLQVLLQAVNGVVEWADANLATWHTKIGRWIAAHSARRGGMSAADIQDEAYTIVQLRDVLVVVAHHGRPRKLTFEQAMGSLESVLLRHLGP